MKKYLNEEKNISIEVPENYSLVDKKHYAQIGLDQTAQNQTLFLFVDANSSEAESFNVTHDATYENDEIALTKGVEANIANLEKQNAIIASKENFVSLNGKELVKVMVVLHEIYINLIFTSVDGLLLCVGYANQDQDAKKEMLFEQIASSISKI